MSDQNRPLIKYENKISMKLKTVEKASKAEFRSLQHFDNLQSLQNFFYYKTEPRMELFSDRLLSVTKNFISRHMLY